MRRTIGFLSGMVLAATIGTGIASADPINDNSRYVPALCDGEAVELVTVQGAAAHVVGDNRVFVLVGATMDGEWLIPIAVPGLAKQDLVECVYTQLFHGHQFVIYGIFSGR